MRSLFKITCIIILSAFVFVSCAEDGKIFTTTDLVIQTDKGPVRGMNEGDMYSFRGIPYAAPPVGELRLAPPLPAPDRGGEILDAFEFGNMCPQISISTADLSLTGDEDCLTLNIFTPARKIKKLLPVMVWIHGGAFFFGSSCEDLYDSPGLISQDVIVVTINYRLGHLGFMAHETLTDEQGESGNYGIMDQQLTLKWVRDNIQNFGGDPDNVTIFGESAGGHSVLTHMSAPGSQGLFHKAIVQSGSYSPWQISMEKAYDYYGNPFASASGCDSEDDIPACFRSLPVEDVINYQMQALNSQHVPAFGGNFLPKSIETTLAEGDFPEIPLLIGGTKDEGALFVAFFLVAGLDSMNENDYKSLVDIIITVNEDLRDDPRNIDFETVADKYDVYDKEDPYRFHMALSGIWTDYMFNFGKALHWDQLSIKTDTYAYWFTDTDAPVSPPLLEDALASSGHADFIPRLGASHFFEIQYIFGKIADRDVTPQQIALSDSMISFWAQFAKTGEPGGGWAPYDPDNGKVVMELNPSGPAPVDSEEFRTYHLFDYWTNPPLVD